MILRRFLTLYISLVLVCSFCIIPIKLVNSQWSMEYLSFSKVNIACETQSPDYPTTTFAYQIFLKEKSDVLLTKRSYELMPDMSDTTYPEITIDYPENFMTAEKSYINIQGKVIDDESGIQSISINGKKQSFTSDGSFEKKGIPLVDGLNRFEIKATNNDSLTAIKILKIYGEGIGNNANLVIVLNIGKTTAFINGDENVLDSPPYIMKGKTLVPLRFIGEGFGAEILWLPKLGEGSISIVLDDKKILLELGNKTATINENRVNLDVPPEIRNGRTFVPLRFIAEAFGAKVEWEAKTQTITIVLAK